MAEFKTGTVEGTTAAIAVTVGFVPSYVKLINIDGDATMEWTEDLADGEGFKDLPTGTMALMATGGITPKGPGGSYLGFQIGTDSDVNGSAETIIWIAHKE